MIIVGLTGSIGMGKTTASAMLKAMRLPVSDADATVHRMLAPGGEAVPHVLAAFPDVQRADGGIDRIRLGRIVFSDPQALRRLEAILHPRVRAAERRFLAAAARRGTDMVILDIPLLYETGAERRCHAVIVVSAPAFLQRQRVMRRPGMTEAKFRRILTQQLPDGEKRRRTPFVVRTGRGKRETARELRQALERIRRTAGRRRRYNLDSGRHCGTQWPQPAKTEDSG